MRPAALALFALPLLAGCPAGPAFPDLQPLTGTLTRDGQPVTSGGLLFSPDGSPAGGYIINAAIRPDGTFTAETSKVLGGGTVIQPGVPVGTYIARYHPASDGAVSYLATDCPEKVTVAVGPNRVALTLPPPVAAEPRTPPTGRTAPTGKR
jgi:hypothetical protein